MMALAHTTVNNAVDIAKPELKIRSGIVSPTNGSMRRNQMKNILAVLPIALFFVLDVLSASAQTLSSPTIFLQAPAINKPLGLTTDLQNNLLTYDTNDGLFYYINSYSPAGVRQSSTRASTGLLDFAGAKMARSPLDGTVYYLRSNGELWAYLVGERRIAALGSLAQTAPSENIPFDVQAGRSTATLGSFFFPQRATYGDIAIFTSGQIFDFLITAKSQPHQFLLRLRYVGGRFNSLKVLAGSTEVVDRGQGLPPGVAVNRSGLALLTLPVRFRPAELFAADRLYSLPENFEPSRWTSAATVLTELNRCRGAPLTCRVPRPLFPTAATGGRPAFVASSGMDSDAAGNFYLVAPGVGIASCGTPYPSSFGVISRTLATFRCGALPFARQFATITGSDLAVSANNASLYIMGSAGVLNPPFFVVRYTLSGLGTLRASAATANLAADALEAAAAPRLDQTLPVR